MNENMYLSALNMFYALLLKNKQFELTINFLMERDDLTREQAIETIFLDASCLNFKTKRNEK